MEQMELDLVKILPSMFLYNFVFACAVVIVLWLCLVDQLTNRP